MRLINTNGEVVEADISEKVFRVVFEPKGYRRYVEPAAKSPTTKKKKGKT